MGPLTDTTVLASSSPARGRSPSATVSGTQCPLGWKGRCARSRAWGGPGMRSHRILDGAQQCGAVCAPSWIPSFQVQRDEPRFRGRAVADLTVKCYSGKSGWPLDARVCHTRVRPRRRGADDQGACGQHGHFAPCCYELTQIKMPVSPQVLLGTSARVLSGCRQGPGHPLRGGNGCLLGG